MLILQIFSIITLFYFVNTFNILTIWYLAGIYLVLLGSWLLLDDCGIFVGFLWVIDLGVGLIFFIFILHYSTFLHQKSNLNKTSREFSFIFLSVVSVFSIFLFFSSPVNTTSTQELTRNWFFAISWYDYFDFFFTSTVTDLNLLHEIYFLSNAFEFFLINFFLLYGIIASILATFLIKKIFNVLNFSQLNNSNFLNNQKSGYFIRTQDYLKQQSTSTGTRVWIKKKNTKV